MTDWNYQHEIAERLVDELLDLIHKYDETMVNATAIGCLDLVKAQLIADALEEDEDD